MTGGCLFQSLNIWRQISNVGLGCGTWLWDLAVGLGYGTWLWDLNVGLGCGTWLWDLAVGLGCGTWPWDLAIKVSTKFQFDAKTFPFFKSIFGLDGDESGWLETSLSPLFLFFKKESHGRRLMFSGRFKKVFSSQVRRAAPLDRMTRKFISSHNSLMTLERAEENR